VPELRRSVAVDVCAVPVVRTEADVSHFAFVNPGGPSQPDYAKAAKHGIKRLYWQANDEQLTKGVIEAVGKRGIAPGLMRDPTWGTLSRLEYDALRAKGGKPTPLDAPTLAHTLSQDLTRFGFDPSTTSDSCAVLVDFEEHSVTYMLTFLEIWRELRSTRVTGWTLEPHQGGWFTSDLVRLLMQTKVAVFPQAYYGDATPTDVDWTRCDLIERGLPRGLVSACYSALQIPQYWDGIAFPFHELP
jgi:hypothetical protein